MTTAASLVMSSAIGIAVSLHLYGIAAAIAVLVAAVLRLLGWVERRLLRG